VAQFLKEYIVKEIVKEIRIFFHKEPPGFLTVFFLKLITIVITGDMLIKVVFSF